MSPRHRDPHPCKCRRRFPLGWMLPHHSFESYSPLRTPRDTSRCRHLLENRPVLTSRIAMPAGRIRFSWTARPPIAKLPRTRRSPRDNNRLTSGTAARDLYRTKSTSRRYPSPANGFGSFQTPHRQIKRRRTQQILRPEKNGWHRGKPRSSRSRATLDAGCGI